MTAPPWPRTLLVQSPRPASISRWRAGPCRTAPFGRRRGSSRGLRRTQRPGERKLLVATRARMAPAWSVVSLRARVRYRGRENPSRPDGHRVWSEGSARRSGNGMRKRPSGRIEDAEAIPVAFACSPLTALRPSRSWSRPSIHPRPSRTGGSCARSNRSRAGAAVTIEPVPKLDDDRELS
jgi:hypothetical protein